MKIIITLLLLFAVAAIIIFFYKKQKAPLQKNADKFHPPLSKSSYDKKNEITQKQTSTNSNSIKIINSEIHSELKEINYFALADDIFPTTLQNLEEEDRKIIERKISVLPIIPTTSTKLLGLLRNPESNLNKITSLVSTNPVFSGNILKTINSAYFKLPENVTSIGRAITLLGYNNVRTIIFRETINNVVPKNLNMESSVYIKTWIHSAVVSTCAGYIGKTYFKFSEYDLATIGLLHDIGKYFLSALKSSLEIVSDIPTIIKEEHRYGINHAVAGQLIAAKWKLPDAIVHGIEFHHYPSFFPPESIPKQYRTQCFTICLADLIAKALGYHGQDEQLLPIKDEYFKLFEIDKDIGGIITADLVKNIEKSRLTVESYIDSA